MIQYSGVDNGFTPHSQSSHIQLGHFGHYINLFTVSCPAFLSSGQTSRHDYLLLECIQYASTQTAVLVLNLNSYKNSWT